MDAKRIDSGKTITIAPAANVRAGDVVIVEDLHGVAPYPISSGGTGPIDLEGKFELPHSGGAVSQGKAAYWHTTSKYVTGTSGAGVTKIGNFAEPVVSGAAVCRVVVRN